MNPEILKKLKTVGLLSEQALDLGQVPTGSYALNRVISGSYTGGIPIGGITEFIGESSTAKSVKVISVLIQAQKLGYYVIYLDCENALNTSFVTNLGLDLKNTLYYTPDTIEASFDCMSEAIKAIRAVDKDTPIVIGYDSLAASPTKSELEAVTFGGTNMDGAIRAKITGGCLKKINHTLRKEKVALIFVNQIRNKVGVMFGSPDTPASGGRSLPYYLHVDLKTISNKTGDLIKDNKDNQIGIKGKVRNLKNRISVPYQECEFELIYNKGLTPTYGLLEWLVKDSYIKHEKGKQYFYAGEKAFFKKDFDKLLADKEVKEFDKIREVLSFDTTA